MFSAFEKENIVNSLEEEFDFKDAKTYKGILCPKCKSDRFGRLYKGKDTKNRGWMCYKCIKL